ncbi:hypothetical protein ES703_92617 [subsurface metagenome]
MLGKRRTFITNDRAVCRLLVSVYPRIEYSVALGVTRVKVVVGLEIVHDKILGCHEAPDVTRPGTWGLGLIYFINLPVISHA